VIGIGAQRQGDDQDLRSRLAEAEDTLRAIRSGEVDGLVVQGPDADRVFTLDGADSFYRVLVDQMPEGAVVLDAAATIVYANARLADMVGAELRQVVGRTFTELLPDAFRGAMDEALAGGVRGLVVGVDELSVSPRGTVPVAIAMRLITDGQAAVHCLIISDLTDRKQAEHAVAHLAAVVDSSVDAIISEDLDGVVRSWNTAAEIMFGFPEAEVIGRHVTETTAQGHEGEVAEILRRVGHGQLVELHETTRATKAQGSIEVAVTVSPIKDAAGRIVGASEISRDVSERNRIEAALREAEARFRSAFDQAGTGMALIGIEGAEAGRFLQVNGELCRLTHYSEEELVGTLFSALVHRDDAAQSAVGLQQLLTGELAISIGEIRVIAADASVLWALATTSVVHHGDGTPSYRILQLQDITERKRFESQLHHLADHDPLTGVFNRARFERELDRETAAAHRYQTGGALLTLDLDHFKQINDSLGHAAGDDVLRAAASTLHGRLRASDILGRLGGDEFAVILPHTDHDQAVEVAGMLGRAVRERVDVATARGARNATASIGVAMFDDGARRLSSEELMLAADNALYDAKDAGPGLVRVADPAGVPTSALSPRYTWAERIREALSADRFLLYTQPIVPLVGDVAPRFEVLLRMRGGSDEVIPPASFIPVAERFDLIQEIDQWVVRHALELLANGTSTGPGTCFDLNVSAKSMLDGRLSSSIGRELEVTGVDPRRLTFEITESAAIINIAQAAKFARSVKRLGAGFALDDFGAGFSSFYYLKHLDFDYLKIDGEFIRDLVNSPTDQVIVRAIVEMARGLNRQTIAEFVGDEPTVSLLRELGVDHAQGFHLGRPRPLDRAESAAARSATPS
jgi:diguanylate cyclase (GGDEF)-like protein/PAS domain S-box-containing protein